MGGIGRIAITLILTIPLRKREFVEAGVMRSKGTKGRELI